MAYVSIDIDMDDFDTDDLLDELKNRNSLFDKKMIDEFIKEHQEINTPDVKNFSLINKMKLDFLIENIERISLEDLEHCVNSRH